MQRTLLMLLTGCLILLSSCHPHSSADPFDDTLNKQKASEDFKLFKKILEDAHPALTEYLGNDRKDFLFDSVYKTIDDDITLRSLYNKFSFLADEIGCSHTYTSFPSAINDSLQKKAMFFPMPLIYIDGNLLANSDRVVPHGSKILSVNNIPAEKLLDSLSMYHTIEGNHRETQRYMVATDFGIDYFTRFGGKERFEVLIKDTSGNIQTQLLHAVTLEEWNNRNNNLSYFDATDVSYSLTVNDDRDYASIRLPSFEFETTNQQNAFEEFLKNSFELLSKKGNIKNLLIDLRENTGGDLYNCFLFYSYLSKAKFLEYKEVVTRINKVPYDDYMSLASYERSKHVNRKLDTAFVKNNTSSYWLAPSSIQEWTPDKFAFTGRVFIITNSRVMSAASYFTLLCKHDGAKVVGVETTGGEYTGNGFTMLEYTLPNSLIKFGFPYVQIKYTYGKEKTGRGIIPDYIVPDTYSSFSNNSDQQLNFITDSLLQKNR